MNNAYLRDKIIPCEKNALANVLPEMMGPQCISLTRNYFIMK